MHRPSDIKQVKMGKAEYREWAESVFNFIKFSPLALVGFAITVIIFGGLLFLIGSILLFGLRIAHFVWG